MFLGAHPARSGDSGWRGSFFFSIVGICSWTFLLPFGVCLAFVATFLSLPRRCSTARGAPLWRWHKPAVRRAQVCTSEIVPTGSWPLAESFRVGRCGSRHGSPFWPRPGSLATVAATAMGSSFALRCTRSAPISQDPRRKWQKHPNGRPGTYLCHHSHILMSS